MGTPAGSTPSTTTRPPSPVAGAARGHRRLRQREHRDPGRDHARAALGGVGGHQVDAVAHRQQCGHLGVGQAHRQRDHARAGVLAQTGPDQPGAAHRLAPGQGRGQHLADGLRHEVGGHAVEREVDRRQVVGRDDRAAGQVVGGDPHRHAGWGRLGGRLQPGQHGDRAEQGGEQAAPGQHRAAYAEGGATQAGQRRVGVARVGGEHPATLGRAGPLPLRSSTAPTGAAQEEAAGVLLEVLLDDPDEVEPLLDGSLLEDDSLLGGVDGADEPLLPEPLLPEPDSLRLSVR